MEESKKEKNKITHRNLLVYLLILFLAINVSFWTTIMVKSIAFGPHKRAKFVLANAIYLNFYVIPIGKVFGPDVIILKPARQVRDKLYYSGIKLLPADDAEREMWWYATRYMDYTETYKQNVMEYARGHISQKEAHLDDLLMFTDEMYYHLYKIAFTHKLKDKYFKELRFKIFTNQVSFDYVNDRMLMLNKKYNGSIPKEEYKKLENLWGWYLSLKDYCKKNEKNGYNMLFESKKMKHSEPLLGYLIVNFILDEKIKEGKFNCHNTIANENAIINYKDSKYILEILTRRDPALIYEKHVLNNEQFDFSNVAKKIGLECKYIKSSITQ